MQYRTLRTSLALLIGTLAFGTFGYHLMENMSYFDAFYMTMITISTVGFSEVKPLSPAGRVITVVLITTGITILTYTFSMIVRMFVEGELRKTFGRRKVEKQIAKLKNHFIICGYGRIGRTICDDLATENTRFVVIEKDASKIAEVEKKHLLGLNMDATSEETLLKAGIMNARAIVTAVRSDANNVFIALTAKGLRPDLFILSRASDEKNEDKLRRAGASRVVSPYLIGGRRMAQVLKRPTVVDFIDTAMMESSLGLMMEEAQLKAGSDLIGKNLIDSRLRHDFGVIIVAIKKTSGEMVFNPLPTEKLEADDILVVLGKKNDLLRMNKIL